MGKFAHTEIITCKICTLIFEGRKEGIKKKRATFSGPKTLLNILELKIFNIMGIAKEKISKEKIITKST